MSALPNAPSAAPAQAAPRRAGAFWPVLTWLILQLLALMAAAFRVPFSAKFPAMGEQLAVQEVLVVQMITSALLFPLLFRSLAVAAVVVGSAMVMLQLAGVLAAARFEPLLAVCAYAGLWLAGLGLWAAALRGERAQMYGVAGASVLSVGGAVLAYLARESVAPGMPFDWPAHGSFGPLMGAVTLLESGERTTQPWAFLGTFLIAASLAAICRRVFGPKTPAV